MTSKRKHFIKNLITWIYIHSKIALTLTKIHLMQGEAVQSISVNVKQSSQHVEVNLSELKGYEKHVIVELMEERSTKLPTALPCTIANCRGNFSPLEIISAVSFRVHDLSCVYAFRQPLFSMKQTNYQQMPYYILDGYWKGIEDVIRSSFAAMMSQNSIQLRHFAK